MTIEKYVEGLKELVPAHFIENTKDWSTSDKMYVFLHYIQLKNMEEIKTLIYAKCKQIKEKGAEAPFFSMNKLTLLLIT